MPNDLTFDGTEVIEANTDINPPADLSDDSDSDAEVPYENPQTGEVSLKRAGSPSADPNRPSKNAKVIGGKAAIPKKCIADYDSDDGRIIELKQMGYKDNYVAQKMVEEGRTRYQEKTITSRWSRLRKVIEANEDQRLDDEMSDWHVGEDMELHESVRSIDAKFEVDFQRLLDKKWKQIRDQLTARLDKKKFTARACRERFKDLQANTALLPIELDPDQDGRRMMREERIAANIRRREEAVAAVEREKAEKHARVDAKKAEADARVRAIADRKRDHEEQKAEEDRMRKLRATERDTAREARKAAAEHASAVHQWSVKQRHYEREIFEKYGGKWRRGDHHHDPTLLNFVGGNADAEDADDESDDYDDEENATTINTIPGITTFKGLVKYVATIAPDQTTLVEDDDISSPLLITADTMADPRSKITTDQLIALLKERDLPAKGKDETGLHALARLRAADEQLSRDDLHALIKRNLGKIKGKREEKLKTLAKAEAERFGSGK